MFIDLVQTPTTVDTVQRPLAGLLIVCLGFVCGGKPKESTKILLPFASGPGTIYRQSYMPAGLQTINCRLTWESGSQEHCGKLLSGQGNRKKFGSIIKENICGIILWIDC